MALLGLHCCSWAVPSWGEQGLLCRCSASRRCSFSLRGMGSRVLGLSTHGTWAEPHGHVESSQTRDQTMFPTLAGQCLTTGPPGKSNMNFGYISFYFVIYSVYMELGKTGFPFSVSQPLAFGARYVFVMGDCPLPCRLFGRNPDFYPQDACSTR